MLRVSWSRKAGNSIAEAAYGCLNRGGKQTEDGEGHNVSASNAFNVSISPAVAMAIEM